MKPLADLSGNKQYPEDVKREVRDRKRRKDSVRKPRRRRRDDETVRRGRDDETSGGWDDASMGGGWEDYPKENRKKVKREISRSRSRSRDRMSKKEEGRGKKSVVSKKSFTSEFLHNAWGTNN